MEELSQLCETIMSCEDLVFKLQQDLTKTKAMAPEQGGHGETEKCQVVENFLKELGLKHMWHVDADDARVPGGKRPNLICHLQGKSDRTLWIFSHLDVVDAGDLASWDTDPWTVTKKGDWLYGRGVEDNQQSIVSSLILAYGLKQLGLTPEHSLGLVFLADEENGNTYGLSHLLKEQAELFKPNDLYLVPDFGTSDGNGVEIAEKAIFWLKITTIGQQCHASTPNQGVNALLTSAKLITRLTKELPEIFPEENPLFSPATSTFVPSRHEANPPSVNLVPGVDTFHLDVRLLPEISPALLFTHIRKICQEVASEESAKCDFKIINTQLASGLDPKHPDLTSLGEAINYVYQKKPKLYGVGGGTFAGLLRINDLPAMVFACLENTCHAPNERSSISATLKDSCVMAHLLQKAQA